MKGKPSSKKGTIINVTHTSIDIIPGRVCYVFEIFTLNYENFSPKRGQNGGGRL